GGKVRQKTVLNLGRSFSLPKEQWAELSSRIDEILSKQPRMFTASKNICKPYLIRGSCDKILVE
ncbi:MAG: hypothetical protein Q7U64_15170, partial [Desulfocapsaceae bacterium]|nr:hypothetical protein [Desulfocapsaceae bacterium]